MKKELKEITAEQAFKLHEEIIKNEMMRRVLLAKNAELLNQMKENNFYKLILGDETAQFFAYLSQLEVFYSRNEVETLIRIYRVLTLNLGLLPSNYFDIPPSRLNDILPIATRETFDAWANRARQLLSKDWTIEIRKAKGLITEEDEHKHKYQLYEICNVCGEKHRK